MPNQTDFVAHHTGCLTEDIQASIAVYKKMGFSNISEVYSIAEQNISACFIEIKENYYLELVQFAPDNLGLSKIFKTRNPYYHIGYLVENIESSITRLQGQGFHLVTRFHSEAFPGKTCAFLYSPEMQLIEIIGA